MTRSYGSKQISGKRATSALTQLLYGCTDERLQGFTAASLAGSYNVPLATAERMLDGARLARPQKRIT
jgi:hypothetical protein